MRKFITVLVVISLALVITETALAISPDIKANGSGGPVTILKSETLKVAVSLDSGGFTGVNADWWVAADTPFGWFYLDASTFGWVFAGASHTDLRVTHQGPLFDLSPIEVLNMPDLPEGTYTFYFALDGNMNGLLDEPLVLSSVKVNVISSSENVLDQDGDGFTPAQGDCDDTNPNINPGAAEIVGNWADDDCNLDTPDDGTLTLGSIGDHTVDVGNTLSFTVTAFGMTNGEITLSVTPLPLPGNAAFNVNTGSFNFSPIKDQAGSYVLTFSASDGINTDKETITITAIGAPEGGDTALKGQVLDANDASQNITTPIVGATVTNIETGLSTTTDSNGDFTLSGLTPGENHFDYEGNTAITQDGSSYGAYRGKKELIANVTNVIARPIYIMKIDIVGEVQIDPNNTTVLNNANLGTTLTIPPNTVKNEDGTNFSGLLSISEVPSGFTPASLPETLEPGVIITVQPMGLTFAQPAPITFPNIDNLAPGSQVDIWSLDHSKGEFFIAGTGEVSADGLVINTIKGGIQEASWHFTLPPAGTGDGSSNNNDNQALPNQCKVQSGSQTAVLSGNLTVEHNLISYRSLGQSRAQRLIYNSLHADPQPVIISNLTIPVRSAVPPTVSTSLSVAGVDQGVEIFTDTSGLSESIDETIRQVVQFDASAFETGSYPYRMTLTSNYESSAVSSTLAGNVLVNNQQKSHFGAGWTLNGLGRLLVQENDSILLVEGDGSTKVFRVAPTGENGLKVQLFDTPDMIAAVESGFAGLAPGNFTVTTESETKVENAYVIPVVNFPDTRLDIAAFFNVGPNGFIDEGSTALVPVGDDISIQPPGGNDTFGASFTGFLFLPNSGDVIFTVGIDDAFDLIVNGQSFMKFIGATDFRNFTETAFDLPSGFIPITLNFGERFTEADIVLSAEGGGLPGGVISQEFLFTAIPTDDDTPPSFVAPPGDFSTLVKNDDSTFARIMKDGTQINFDANGLHTSTVDRIGNTTTYAYDANDNLISINDPAGLVTTLTYSGGLLSSITDPAGRSTTFIHDIDGNLTGIVNPNSSIRQFAYDARHRMVSQTSKRGFDTTYGYNFAGRNIQASLPDASTRQLVPIQTVGLVDLSTGIGAQDKPAPVVRPEDVVASYTDGNGNVSTFNTDRFGAITESSSTCCLGRINKIERNADGLPVMITKANGAITKNTYDANGNLLTSADQSIGATTTFTYDTAFNQVTSITDPDSNTTTINYDANGNPIEIIDSQGNTTMLTYYSQGLLKSVADSLSNTSTFTYDSNGNLAATSDPLINVTTLTSDGAGNVTATTDAGNNVTQFVYDALNRLTQVTDANTNVTNYGYDANGNLTLVTDASSNATSFVYDSRERLINNTDPLGNSDIFIYDGNGNLITTTNRKGQTITYGYDKLNQLITKTLPGNLVTTFNYDLIGNLTSVSDPDSNLTFTYDGAGRLTSVSTTSLGFSQQPDVTINYAYDVNGNRITMTDTITGTTNYVYDTLNRVTSITNPANQSVSYSYDALSRRTLTTLPNGVTTDFTYDANSQSTSLNHKLASTTISSFGYSYDNVGNRNAMNTTRTGVAVNNILSYVYDNIYQLTRATRPLPAQPDETFNYDPLGNRSSRDGPATNSTIGAANRLLDDTTFTYAYDNNGNLIQKVDKATNATTDYTYDAENQLIRISLPNGSIAQYRYDGLGRRIEKDVDGGITRYVYDNEDILLEFDGSNTQVARYTHGTGIDEPLIMARGGQSLFYQTDGLGSITDLTDTNGAVTQSYVYDSYGNIEQQVGSLVNPYTYTGREFDAESGLYYYRARYYDPQIGRFLQPDPIGLSGGINFYVYAINNPTIWIDPFGLDSWSGTGVGGGGFLFFGGITHWKGFLTNEITGETCEVEIDCLQFGGGFGGSGGASAVNIPNGPSGGQNLQGSALSGFVSGSVTLGPIGAGGEISLTGANPNRLVDIASKSGGLTKGFGLKLAGGAQRCTVTVLSCTSCPDN